jgi:hypothetical protein
LADVFIHDRPRLQQRQGADWTLSCDRNRRIWAKCGCTKEDAHIGFKNIVCMYVLEKQKNMGICG